MATDQIQKGVEALRKTLDEFTGKSFVYSNQDVVLPYPIGIVTRIFEKRIGFPNKAYTEDGKEVLRQVVDVSVQIDYIVGFNRRKAKDSIFTSRDLLGRIQAAYYSGEWQSFFQGYKEAEGVDMAVMAFEDLTGPTKVDGGQNLWSSRITADLNILSIYEKEDFPCIDDTNAYPFDVRLKLSGRVRNGEADTRDQFIRICSEDEIKTKIAVSSETFSDLNCDS